MQALFFLFVNLIFTTCLCAQEVTKFPNDSLKIFSALDTFPGSDYAFGNGKDGLVRRYRKIDGKWCLTWITLWENGEPVWGQKPYCTGYFESDWWVLNRDSMDIIVPFENGKPWHTAKVRNGKITGEEITYYSSGEMRERLNLAERTFFEYYKNGQVKTWRLGVTQRSTNLMTGTEKRYDESGALLETIEYVNYKRVN